ncbi:hypothetical protein AX15_000305 [Amanita polypyramis BW_CC]|nr:hypothetical protein AX15_000305 [Amanita polypyramis BW_CC]
MRPAIIVLSLLYLFGTSTLALALPHPISNEPTLSQRDVSSPVPWGYTDTSNNLERRYIFSVLKGVFKAIGTGIKKAIELRKARKARKLAAASAHPVNNNNGAKVGGKKRKRGLSEPREERVVRYLNRQRREVGDLLELSARQLMERGVYVDLDELD